jgi:hypothetical protein
VRSPAHLDAPIQQLIAELVALVGEDRVVDECIELLGGAERGEHLDVLPYLTGLSFEPGAVTRDPARWPAYWVRTWGARGLLYVWRERAEAPVLAGLDDEHWRPAEMCLRVATRREIGGAGDEAVRRTTHELARVRAQALRTLAVVGDTEHLDAVRERLDDPDTEVRRRAALALDRLAERLDL